MMADRETVVASTGELVRLSDDAVAMLRAPVPIMPWVEDIYSITTAKPDVPSRWYVVFVRPTHGCAERVDRYGKRFGIRSYWPKRVRLVQRGKGQYRKAVPAETPLMQRYVLMQLPEKNPPFGLLTSHEGQFNGVCGFLGDSRGPISVPDDLVERLMDRERIGEFDETVKRGRRVMRKMPDWAQVNSLVRITSGPFAENTGIVEGYSGHGKLSVGVMLFGRANAVELSLEQLVAVGY